MSKSATSSAGQKKRKRFDWRNILVMLTGLVVAIAIAEIALRIVYASDQTTLMLEFQTNSFTCKNYYWKVWHFVNNSTEIEGKCFSGTYSTNEYGMKDAPVDHSKPKIALIGDSYVEGYGVSNNATIDYYLDSLLQHNYEVLNFGASGGFGNVQELSLYENFASGFEPEVVLLFFLNYNDFYDNVNSIEQGLIDEDLNFTFPSGASFDAVTKYLNRWDEPTVYENSLEGLYVVQAAKKGWLTIEKAAQSSAGTRLEFKDALTDIYTEGQNETIDQGREIFQKCLTRFKELCEKNGSRLILVQLPDPYQTDPDWIASASDKPLDPELPNRQIAAIAAEVDVEYVDMFPAAMDFIDKNQLEFPYMYNICDRHFSELGNRFAAKFLSQVLADTAR